MTISLLLCPTSNSDVPVPEDLHSCLLCLLTFSNLYGFSIISLIDYSTGLIETGFTFTNTAC